jgi:cellulose synthase/poly-beta-1,6-N-acetylglucosamine synthase-like glycosyltransferase
MLFYINIILTLALFPFFAYLALITVAAVVGRRAKKEVPLGSARFVFVIPAHDEEANIRSTIESCQAVNYDPEKYRICVVADNCSDGTALAARAAGAEVVERTDSKNRSKGYALEYLFQHPLYINDVPDAAVLIDADTVVDPSILSVFAEALSDGKKWIQCYYTVRNPDVSWRTRMMTYAFSLFNGVWLQGQDRLGLGVGLKGNGMCFSAKGLELFPWRAHSLAEDLEFSWMLRVAGELIHFAPEAHVRGTMPTRGGSAATAQRLRWESGRRSLRSLFFGPLMRSKRIGPIAKLMYLIDLVFPPLVTLFLGLLVAMSLHLGAGFDPRLLAAKRCLLPVHAAMAMVLVGYVLSPFLAIALPVRYLTSLAALPYYAAWKLLVTFGRNPTAWVRTPREPATCDASG